MSIVGKLLGEAGATAAKGLLDGVGDLATKIRGAITGELPPAARAELEKLASQADSLKVDGQLKVNLAEAQSPRLFVAGWRPFIGWVGGFAIAWYYLVHPLLVWIITLWYIIKEPVVAGTRIPLTTYLPPQADLSGLWPVIVGMLGLGVYRTFEKTKDVQSNH